MNGKYYGRLEVRYHKKEAARLEHIKNKRKRSKTMVKGYKVFNPDWTCKGKQYTCPGTFEEDVNPSVCNVGMHFCKMPQTVSVTMILTRITTLLK